LNKQLLDLYSAKWDQLCAAMRPVLQDTTLEVKPTCPLLLTIHNEEAFATADIRVMVFGQETNSWYDEFHVDMLSIIDQYDGFFNDGECWGYGGQFWNGINRFVALLQAQHPNKTIRLVWNNLVKIGKYDDKGFPPDYIYEVEREHFAVIEAELDIIKPTVVLFLTGPNYDSVVTDNFGSLDYTKIPGSFTERQIAKVFLPSVKSAYRTYHPNYLWRNDINSYFQAIIEQINVDMNRMALEA
jgi:hypothetical protein